MPDFAKLKAFCDSNSTISKSVIDDFLLDYASEKEGLLKKIGPQLGVFRHILAQKEAESWARMLIPQLLAYSLLKKDGVAGRLFNHSAVQKRTPEELDYLKFQIEHPWRFTFCRVSKILQRDFYEMTDVISDEKFLLYSPGITDSNEEAKGFLPLWFLLIGFNGECYQTYGPLAYFKGIQPFDLFFFAKQLKPGIVFQNEMQSVIDSNPTPFAMLFFIGAELPVTYHKKDMVVFYKSEYHIKDFSFDKYEQDFIIEKKHPLYMLSLKRWHTLPHFAKCIFHAKKNLFIITSMTQRGYDSLIMALNKQGNEFPSNPDIFATPAMLHAVKKVLNVNVEMNPYEKHFAKTTSPESQKELDKINVFLKYLIDRLNKKEDYDIADLAAKAGIDVSDAERIAENLINKISTMPR